MSTPDVNTYNPTPLSTPKLSHFQFYQNHCLHTGFLCHLIGVMFPVHQTFQTALVLRRIQEGRSWHRQFKAFLAFLLLALLLSSTWIFSLIILQISLCEWYRTDTEKKCTTRLIINQSLRNPLHYFLIHHSRKCTKRCRCEQAFFGSVLEQGTWWYHSTDGAFFWATFSHQGPSASSVR